jgi:hypothetical protein
MANRMGKPGALFLWVRTFPGLLASYADIRTGVRLPHGLLRLPDSAPSGFQDRICFQP